MFQDCVGDFRRLQDIFDALGVSRKHYVSQEGYWSTQKMRRGCWNLQQARGSIGSVEATGDTFKFFDNLEWYWIVQVAPGN